MLSGHNTEMNQDTIDALGREIRKYYLERKASLYDGQFRLKGDNAEFKHWQKAAVLCLELNATPEVFVDAAFAHCRLQTGPFPNSMYGIACRGWYKSYIAGRATLRASQKQVLDTGGDLISSTEANAHVDALRYDINLVLTSIFRLTGTKEINSQTIEYVSSFTTSYPAYVRVLLGYRDEQVKTLFGAEALKFYNNKPFYSRAAETLGYPIRDILLWLNVPAH